MIFLIFKNLPELGPEFGGNQTSKKFLSFNDQFKDKLLNLRNKALYQIAINKYINLRNYTEYYYYY